MTVPSTAASNSILLGPQCRLCCKCNVLERCQWHCLVIHCAPRLKWLCCAAQQCFGSQSPFAGFGQGRASLHATFAFYCSASLQRPPHPDHVLAVLSLCHEPEDACAQAVLERALSLVLQEGREVLRIHVAGRTDAGVHAVGQVGSWTPHPCVSLKLAAQVQLLCQQHCNSTMKLPC